MQAIREVSNQPSLDHTYLLDGNRCLAYIPAGGTRATYFKETMRFDRRGRKFVPVDMDIFDRPAVDARLVQVQGSGTNTYWVDRELGTCTCPGFNFRGNCKHVKELA